MGGIFNVGLHRLNPYATVYQCHVRIVQNLPGAYTRGGGSTGVLPPNGCMVVVHIDSIVSLCQESREHGEAILSAENSGKPLGSQG